MDQKQLDDLQEPLESDDFENTQETEEKFNDVNEIIDTNEDSENEEELEQPTPTETEVKKNSFEEPKQDPFPSEEPKERKPGAAWKYFSGILIILLVASVYTNGFHFGNSGPTGAALTLIDAEDKVLDYVNNQLLQPPFTAELVSSAEVGGLYKVTLSVAGQEIESYLTQDGRYFFPQGFDLNETTVVNLEDTETTPPTTEETELVDVSADDDPVLGNADAPVTIIEFSDFQCPFCRRGWETVKQVEKEYVETGKVKIVFRDFPLNFHPEAKAAALAAGCANEQDMFWEYHDLLFENQAELSADNYLVWAEELDLDLDDFQDCFDTEKYATEIDADQADGAKYGVTGTPAFFVNGKLISGAQPYAVFEAAIEEALAAGPEPETAAETELDEVADTLAEETVEEPTEEEEPAEEPVAEPAAETEFQIIAKKWRFDPKVVEVTKGDEVTLTINSEFDLNFVLEEFDVEEVITAGETTTVQFTADKKGTFPFSCGTYCYTTYGDVQGAAMNGELVVN